MISYPDDLPIAIITIISTTLSLIACAFVIYCYYRFSELQSASQHIVLKIIYFDVGYCSMMWMVSFSYLIIYSMGSDATIGNFTIWCNFEGFIITFFILSGALWTSIICHSLYSQTINFREGSQLFYNIIALLVPGVLSIIPVFTNSYGIYRPMEQTNCFFIDESIKTYCFYIPMYIMFLFNIISITLVVAHVYKLFKEEQLDPKIIFTLFLYPGILFICWVLPDILFECNVRIDYAFQIIGCLIGLLDSLCYSFLSLRTYLTFDGCHIVRRNNCEIASSSELSLKSTTKI